MDFQQAEIDQLKSITPSLSVAEEGGYTYFLLQNVKLPIGCIPNMTDVLFCPTPHSGYESRLYFPQIITGCPSRNWNGNAVILNKNWHSISWNNVPAGLSLKDKFLCLLKALIPDEK
ncbi:MAG: hypothetical protein JNM67_04410 [Bacteroidetes bacterium]|nr:hypothetical protein [Bacteroidota bacterium]